MTEHNLKVESLSKKIAGRLVLNDISFTLNTGDRVLLLGHNGAGKTTLLKVLAGLMDSDSGNFSRPRVSYQGHDLGSI